MSKKDLKNLHIFPGLQKIRRTPPMTKLSPPREILKQPMKACHQPKGKLKALFSMPKLINTLNTGNNCFPIINLIK
ncbi:hypothetical protein [Streptococcus suis]